MTGAGLIRTARRFRACREAASAVEFALVLPVLLLLYVGLVEATQTLTVDRKSDKLASAIGDLVAQSATVSSSDLSGLFDISGPMLAPFDDASAEMLVADIKFVRDGNNADGTPKWKALVRWAYGRNVTAPACGRPSPVTIPTALMPTTTTGAGVDLVVAQVVVPYRSPFGGMLASVFGSGTYRLDHTYILRPRVSSSVQNSSVAAC